MANLSRNARVLRVSNAEVGATTDITSSTVDTMGYGSVTFYALMGSIAPTAVTSCKVQTGAASDMSDAADIEASSLTIADTDDNGVAIIEIDSPRERYVRLIIDRGTATAVVDGALAVLTKPKVEPVTQSTTVIDTVFQTT